MSRKIYILLVLLAPVILGTTSAIGPLMEKIGLYFTMLVYIPIIGVMRLRYIKLTWKEILLSFIPFYGIKYRFKRFTEK